MKHLRKFKSAAEYDSYVAQGVIRPGVSLVGEKEVHYHPVIPPPLYIEALGNITVTFGNPYEYSKDGIAWVSATSADSISATAGEKIYYRASGLTATSSNGIGRFKIKGAYCNVGGNAMSMLYGADYIGKTEIMQSYALATLFISQTLIKDASDLLLPATTLAAACYKEMFSGCSNLSNAPELPATTLAESCYNGMFKACIYSLVTAPKLPATTLAGYCYDNMFSGCSKLVNAPELPATTLADSCYNSMFMKCTSLVTAPELPASALVRYCYRYMFSGCTKLVNGPTKLGETLAEYCCQAMFADCSKLVNAPELPATSASKTSCYSGMFQNCTSLNYIKAMFTSTPKVNYTSDWVKGVAASGTFVKNSAATWDVTGNYGVPTGWTVETADA